MGLEGLGGDGGSQAFAAGDLAQRMEDVGTIDQNAAILNLFLNGASLLIGGPKPITQARTTEPVSSIVFNSNYSRERYGRSAVNDKILLDADKLSLLTDDNMTAVGKTKSICGALEFDSAVNALNLGVPSDFAELGKPSDINDFSSRPVSMYVNAGKIPGGARDNVMAAFRGDAESEFINAMVSQVGGDTSAFTTFSGIVSDQPLMQSIATDNAAIGMLSAHPNGATAMAQSQTAMTEIAASQMAMQKVAASQTARDEVYTSQTAMQEVAPSQTAMQEVVSSSASMQDVAASQTAMQEVAGSQVAMQEVAGSQVAMQEVAPSQVAMQEVAPSQVAMQEVAASQTAMQEVVASQTARDEVYTSQTAMQEVAPSQTAMQEVVSSSASMQDVTASQPARDEVFATQTAMQEVAASRAALDELAASQASANIVAANSTSVGAIESASSSKSNSVPVTNNASIYVAELSGAGGGGGDDTSSPGPDVPGSGNDGESTTFHESVAEGGSGGIEFRDGTASSGSGSVSAPDVLINSITGGGSDGGFGFAAQAGGDGGFVKALIINTERNSLSLTVGNGGAGGGNDGDDGDNGSATIFTPNVF